jgi:hypothetical protein
MATQACDNPTDGNQSRQSVYAFPSSRTEKNKKFKADKGHGSCGFSFAYRLSRFPLSPLRFHKGQVICKTLFLTRGLILSQKWINSVREMA